MSSLASRSQPEPSAQDGRGLNVLVVDDDPAIRSTLERALGLEGYATQSAADGVEALQLLRNKPDLVVLDVAMPRLDGLALCRRMRAGGDRTPVLMLTARTEVGERIAGLDAGADDYLAKPFALGELYARLRALVRRSDPTDTREELQFGDISMNLTAHEARRGGELLELTRTEYQLLELLLRHPRQVLSRETIYEHIWGYGGLSETSNSLDVYVGYLRRKTEENGRPRVVQTVRGIGFILREE